MSTLALRLPARPAAAPGAAPGPAPQLRAVARPAPALAPGLAPRRRAGPLLAIGLAHAVLVWALLQAQGVRTAIQEARPLMVALLADVAPPTPAEPALPNPRQDRLPPPTLWTPPPEITVAVAAPPAPPPAPMPLPVPTPVQAVALPTPAPVQAPAPVLLPPQPSRPAEPKLMSAGAIRYRVQPAIEVPLASRRLGESGTVLLRVVVDAQGQPRQISVHRSSGFARLDEQALVAMRAARFQPVTDAGTAIEWLVIAPLQYDIE